VRIDDKDKHARVIQHRNQTGKEATGAVDRPQLRSTLAFEKDERNTPRSCARR